MKRKRSRRNTEKDKQSKKKEKKDEKKGSSSAPQKVEEEDIKLLKDGMEAINSAISTLEAGEPGSISEVNDKLTRLYETFRTKVAPKYYDGINCGHWHCTCGGCDGKICKGRSCREMADMGWKKAKEEGMMRVPGTYDTLLPAFFEFPGVNVQFAEPECAFVSGFSKDQYYRIFCLARLQY
eukprot:CAMPEP_0174253188 /NCGR_PEP_ID=MMETSP0439-20130205/2580_1 /TAXON_ID=0 /ORGANISM="Stereomyxa ramosa, Strain Chinc5" /LENGTH=180 /DNA_ID=CAMNT_0015334091 /DNA_START=44 /DNA_END=586 /DNA_ORIENTATION=-